MAGVAAPGRWNRRLVTAGKAGHWCRSRTPTQIMNDADGLIEVHDPCGAVRGAVVGADSASLPEGTVVQAADGAVDVVVAVADGEVDQA